LIKAINGKLSWGKFQNPALADKEPENNSGDKTFKSWILFNLLENRLIFLV
jgi:hypothetical protein